MSLGKGTKSRKPMKGRWKWAKKSPGGCPCSARQDRTACPACLCHLLIPDKQTCALGCFCPHLLPTLIILFPSPFPDSVPPSNSSQNSAWHIIIISVRSVSYYYYNYLHHHYPCSSKPIQMDLSSCGLDFPTPPSLRPKLSGDQSQWK